jgi:hypothetical protein
MRCLEKDPWDRFATAMDLRGALESVTFFTARGGTGGAREASGVRGTIVILIAGVAVLIGLLAGLALR